METIQKVKVNNMESNRFPNSRKVPNQFIIETYEGFYFQSYDSVIAFKPRRDKYSVAAILDVKYWDYSTTTGKYRNQFLGEDKKTTQKKINDGTYVLADLNETN